VTATTAAASAATTAPPAAPPAEGPGTAAAFLRFVLCGGGTGLLASGALVLLTGALPVALANALVTVASTVLATELHGRFTFGAGRPGLPEHLRSAATAATAYLVTTAALVVLHAAAPGAGAALQQVVYLSANALAGVGRFLVLRAVVFTRSAVRTEPAARPALQLSRTAVTTAA